MKSRYFSRQTGNYLLKGMAILITALMILLQFHLPPTWAAGSGLTVAMSSPVSSQGTSDDTQINYQIDDKINPGNVHLTWEFTNGIDQNLYSNIQKITLTNKNTHQTVLLDIGQESDCVIGTDGTCTAGDFTYTSSNTPKVRQLELILTGVVLDDNSQYVVRMDTGILANNASTLGKIYKWSFQTSGSASDLDPPVAPADETDTDAGNDMGGAPSNKPDVIFYSPAAQTESYEVDTDSPMVIGFSEAIDPVSIGNGSEVTLQQLGTLNSPTAGGIQIDCTFAFNDENTELTLTPSQKLINGAHYKLTVPGELKDQRGNVLGTDASVTFYTKPAVIPNSVSVVLSGDSDEVSSLEAGKTYELKIKPTNKSDIAIHDARMYLVARGGIGARLEHGGDILESGYFDISAAVNSDFDQQTITFIVPEDITGNVYVDVMVRETDTVRANPRMLAETKHFELQVIGGEE